MKYSKCTHVLFLSLLPYRGSALSLVMSYIFTPFFLIAYVWGRGLHKQTWKGWSWDSLTEWSLFFKLGVPGLLMICFEWWTYEISTIVAGSINELQLAVNTILMQFGMIMYSVRTMIHCSTCSSYDNLSDWDWDRMNMSQ